MDAPCSPLYRVVSCHQCGAPVQTELEADQFNCQHCGSLHQFLTERPMLAERESSAAIPGHEEQRRQALRGQRLRHLFLRPPPDLLKQIEALPDGEAGIQELMNHWLPIRNQVEQEAEDTERDHRFYWLTVVLANRLAVEDQRRRALFESALGALHRDEHRQRIYGMLARHAAAQGELDNAEVWLDYCDVRSDDLGVDSAWRVSAAFIAMMREDHEKVLTLLGVGMHSWPVAFELHTMGGLLRAHALEQTGQPTEAAEALRPHLGPSMTRTLARWGRPELLQASLGPAIARRRRHDRIVTTVLTLMGIGLAWLGGWGLMAPGLLEKAGGALGLLLAAVLAWVLVSQVRTARSFQRWVRSL